MKYVYEGPVPVADETGEIVHPLDVRECDEAPDCPPWRLIDEAEHSPAGSGPASAPQAAPGSAAPVSVPPAPVTSPKGN